jgi:hypothetical protein
MYCALRARLDGVSVTLNDYEARAVDGYKQQYASVNTHLESLPYNVLIIALIKITAGKPSAFLIVSEDVGVAKGPFGCVRSTILKSNPFSPETVIPVPLLPRGSSPSPDKSGREVFDGGACWAFGGPGCGDKDCGGVPGFRGLFKARLRRCLLPLWCSSSE